MNTSRIADSSRNVTMQDLAAQVPNALAIGPFGSDLKTTDYAPDGVPVVFVKNVRPNEFTPKDWRYVSDDKAEQLAAHRVTGGDILITKMGLPPCVAAVYPNDAPDGIVTADIIKLTPDPNTVDPRYVVYFLNSSFAKRQVEMFTNGVTRPKVTLGAFRSMSIPLPPLAKQKRIADILDKANAIRRKRQEVLEVIATSYKSLFLSMFGDPVENHRGLPVKTIADLATRISKGESPKWQGFEYQDDGVQFITSENVRWGNLDTSTPKYIPHAFHTKLERSQLAKDDLLINLVGASVGRAALVPETELPANVNQAVAVISLDRKQILPSFLLHQLLNDRVQRVLLGNVVESARANISLTNIRETMVLVPHINEQLAWDEIVRSTAKLTDSSKRAWQECNDLFNSLVQGAFKGEL